MDAAAIAALPTWVCIGTGGLRQDGLPAVESVSGRLFQAPHPDTGIMVPCMCDVHAHDLRVNGWCLADLSQGLLVPMAQGLPIAWALARAAWLPVPPPPM